MKSGTMFKAMNPKAQTWITKGLLALLVIALLLFSGYFWLGLGLALGGWLFSSIGAAQSGVVRLVKAIFKKSSGTLR